MIELNGIYRANHPAFVMGERVLTHAAFAARARRLASALYRGGCRRQDRVAILSQNSLEQCEVFGAGEIAGFIIASINFRLSPEEVAYQIDDCAARVFLFQERYAPLVAEIRAKPSGITQFVCIGEAPDWAVSYEDFLASGDAAGPPCAAEDDDIAYLVYTSGTTGKPKGCMLAHAAHLHAATACASDIQMSRMDRTLVAMPLFHMGGKIVALATQWHGATTLIVERFEENEYLRTLQDQRVTVAHLAPMMIAGLLEVPGVGDFDFSALRMIFYSAAPIPVAILRRGISVFGRVFHQAYGLTEGSGASLHRDQHDPDGDEKAIRRLGSVGTPFPGVELRIGDENDDPAPTGAPGEILLRSAGVMAGYWNNSVATNAALRNGWLHTGDIGVMDEDGFTYLVDRKKDMINSGGENIYSREVEEVLFQDPDILEAAVIGVPDPKWGEAVRAVVVPREGRAPTEDSVIAHCQSKLASYKKPRSVIFTKALPRLASGKYDKVTMRRLFGG
jgi:acyl-CoA synthetase (AMP-forming)/AMP-acid ligase II